MTNPHLDPIQAIFDQRNRERQALDAWRAQVKAHVSTALENFEPAALETETLLIDEGLSEGAAHAIVATMRMSLLAGLTNTLQISVVAGRPLDSVVAQLYPMEKMFAIVTEEVPAA